MSEMQFEIVDGNIDAPYCMGIYGAGGSGKTWLSSYAEDPMIIPLESGANHVPVKKFKTKPKDIDQVFEMVRYIIKNPNICKTVVFDSLGYFQSMVYADIMKKHPTTGGADPKPVTGISDYAFHKGYSMALPYFEKLLVAIDALQEKDLNVILITHSQQKNTQTESGDSFKIIDFALQSSNNGDVCELLRRRLDVCLYMQSVARTGKKKGGFGGSTTVAMVGSRPEVLVHTRASSTFFAKVRTANESEVETTYVIDPDNIDESSRKIFIDTVGQKRENNEPLNHKTRRSNTPKY